MDTEDAFRVASGCWVVHAELSLLLSGRRDDNFLGGVARVRCSRKSRYYNLPNPLGIYVHHRWTRCRSTMALLEGFLGDLAYSLKHPERGDRTFLELISRGREEPPKGYALTEEQREEVKTRIETLRELGHWNISLEPGAPKPPAALHIRPTF